MAYQLDEHDQTSSIFFDVARNRYNNCKQLNIFGYQPTVVTTAICIWENPVAYVYPAAAVVMTLVSDSALDDTNLQIVITGTGADYVALTEIININGTTPVNTTNAFLRINNMRVSLVNPLRVTNAGTITATNGGVSYAKILPTVGQTQMSQYTVPAGHTFHLTRVDCFAQQSGGTNNFNTYSVQAATPFVTYSVLQSPYFERYEAVRVVPFRYEEKTSVQWRSRTETNTSSVGMVIEGILTWDE